MTRTRRRTYFFLLVVIFFLVAPAVTLYSQGYTFNLTSLTFNKTGAIFVSTSPKGIRIFINNTLETVTGDTIFSQGKLISHLVPGTYDVRIEKDGYFPWEKTLQVDPQLVTEARNIFLVPRETTPVVIDEKVSDMIASASNAKIAYVKSDGAAILDVSSPKIIPLITNLQEKVGKMRFGADENYLLIESFLKNKVRKYLLNTTSGETADIQEDELNPFVKMRQYPQSEPKVIALAADRTLYWVDTRSAEEKTTIAVHVVNFEIFGDKIVYATTEPTIFYQKDLVSGLTVQLTQTPAAPFGPSSTIIRSRGGFIAYVDDKKSLYLYDNDQGIFQKIADNVSSALFSDDDKKLAWQNSKEIWVYYLKDTAIQPKKTKGDTELITRFSKPIGPLAWFSYDNEHILFVADGKLKLVELDGRDKRNMYDITDVKKPTKVMYNNFDDFIYFLDDQTLKKITLIKT